MLGYSDDERAELRRSGAVWKDVDAVSERPRLPLEGVRVVDMTWVWAGPYASMLLAMLGAEVIKVESRDRLDFFRRYVIWPLADAAPTELPPEEVDDVPHRQHEQARRHPQPGAPRRHRPR